MPAFKGKLPHAKGLGLDGGPGVLGPSLMITTGQQPGMKENHEEPSFVC